MATALKIKTADDLWDLYEVNPVEFVKDTLGIPPTKQQAELLMSVVDNKKTHCRSGRGIGKTWGIDFLAMWFLSCFHDAIVIITATNNNQLYDVLWAQLKKLYERWELKQFFEILDYHKTMRMINHHSTFLVAKSSERAGTTKESAMSGFHADNMLIIIDEGAGVDDVIYNSLEKSMTGVNNKMVVTGNPVRGEGMFYDIPTKYRDYWNCLKFSSLDSPLTDKGNIQKDVEVWGIDSDMIRVNYLGEFPKHGSSDVLIGLDKIEHCVNNVDRQDGLCQIGVDVARMGDDLTCISILEGNALTKILTYPKIDDFNQLSGIIVNEIKEHKASSVKIDASGMGIGLVDILRQALYVLQLDCKVIPITFGMKATKPSAYCDNISEMWCNAKTLIDNGEVSIPNNNRLIKELSTRKYSIDSKGRIKIESKADYKKRHKQSPDFADSFNLVCYNPYNITDIEITATGDDLRKGY